MKCVPLYLAIGLKQIAPKGLQILNAFNFEDISYIIFLLDQSYMFDYLGVDTQCQLMSLFLSALEHMHRFSANSFILIRADRHFPQFLERGFLIFLNVFKSCLKHWSCVLAIVCLWKCYTSPQPTEYSLPVEVFKSHKLRKCQRLCKRAFTSIKA